MNYTKPSPDLVRKVTNAFGSLKATKMIAIRQRAMKILMMDYVGFCKESQMSKEDTKKAVMAAIDKSIELGISTPVLKDTINSFIDKKYRSIDPLLRLHCAVTMETLDVTTEEGEEPTPASLPEEVQEASECGADCFGGTAPSLESLNKGVPECQAKLFRAVGGSICDQMLRSLENVLSSDYLSKR